MCYNVSVRKVKRRRKKDSLISRICLSPQDFMPTGLPYFFPLFGFVGLIPFFPQLILIFNEFNPLLFFIQRRGVN